MKGPGDRLQDNQRRLLEFCVSHQMPVSVCYVRWAGASLTEPADLRGWQGRIGCLYLDRRVVPRLRPALRSGEP